MEQDSYHESGVRQGVIKRDFQRGFPTRVSPFEQLVSKNREKVQR